MTLRVFISYSHDSEAHSLRVLELSNRLRSDGIDANIDRYVNDSPAEGWGSWMEREIHAADFVIVVCTNAYQDKFGNTKRDALWEGSLVSQSIFDHDNKFIPVIFDNSPALIPPFLRGNIFYKLPGAYEELYRTLTNQSLNVTPVLGERQESVTVGSKGAFSVGGQDGDVPDSGQFTRNLVHLLDLQEAWKQKRLSVIAGAGVGVAAGMPTWPDLLKVLLTEFVRKTYAFSDSAETEAMIDALQHRLQKQSPIIYAQFVRSRFEEKDFINLLHQTLYPKGKTTYNSPICKSIARLAHQLNCVLTFNYDSLIEDALLSEGHSNTPVYDAGCWSSIVGLPVYHPHGYLPRERLAEKKYRVILSESDYHTQYHSPNIWSNIAISRVLLENVCLLVGTSLEDPNLRRLLDASYREQRDKKHFILARSPIVDDSNLNSPVAQAMLEVYAASYQQLGVTPIWFEDHDEIPLLIDSIRDLTINNG